MAAKDRALPLPIPGVMFFLGPKERAELGHLPAWARAARDVYDLYCKAVEKNPDVVLTITVTSA